jgi:stage II sporulation protein D
MDRYLLNAFLSWLFIFPCLEASAQPSIRVAVVVDQAKADLAVKGDFRIISLKTSQVVAQGDSLNKSSVRAENQLIILDDKPISEGGIRIEPAKAAAIDVNGQRLRGLVEVLPRPGSTIIIINHLGIEDYLQGVIGKEAPFYWPKEALKAITIVARTYALFQRESKDSEVYDVTGTVLSQVYGGKKAEKLRTNRSVRDTSGLVLTYNGKIFPAFYHSTCGGLTENGYVMGKFDIAPLKGGVRCSFCSESPFFRWQRRVTKEDLAWAVKKSGRDSIWPVENLEITRYTPTGRVEQLRISGKSKSVYLSGYEFRQILGFERIRSTAFAVVKDNDGFILQGHGWGHGVGLCQWGSAELARKGLSAREILSYYYPGAELRRVEEVQL